jgi:DNA-binding response OmpR family regulator
MTRPILVVDDEDDLAAVCQRLLSRRGWTVVTAGSRTAALGILARDQLALVIVDRQLPDGDGVEVLRAALACRTPVIMVTGYGSVATRRLSLEEGAAGFLAKPFSAHELLELVRAIVGDGSGPMGGPVAPPPAAEPPRPGIHC